MLGLTSQLPVSQSQQRPTSLMLGRTNLFSSNSNGNTGSASGHNSHTGSVGVNVLPLTSPMSLSNSSASPSTDSSSDQFEFPNHQDTEITGTLDSATNKTMLTDAIHPECLSTASSSSSTTALSPDSQSWRSTSPLDEHEHENENENGNFHSDSFSCDHDCDSNSSSTGASSSFIDDDCQEGDNSDDAVVGILRSPWGKDNTNSSSQDDAFALDGTGDDNDDRESSSFFFFLPSPNSKNPETPAISIASTAVATPKASANSTTTKTPPKDHFRVDEDDFFDDGYDDDDFIMIEPVNTNTHSYSATQNFASWPGSPMAAAGHDGKMQSPPRIEIDPIDGGDDEHLSEGITAKVKTHVSSLLMNGLSPILEEESEQPPDTDDDVRSPDDDSTPSISSKDSCSSLDENEQQDHYDDQFENGSLNSPSSSPVSLGKDCLTPVPPELLPEDDLHGPHSGQSFVVKNRVELDSLSPNSVAHGMINLLIPLPCSSNNDECDSSLQEETTYDNATTYETGLATETDSVDGVDSISSSLSNWDAEEARRLAETRQVMALQCVNALAFFLA